jgi:cardiolipin synthase A/B
MLRVDDPGFAQQMRDYFEKECAASTAITPEVHRQRSTLLNRLRWAASFYLVTTADYSITRRLNLGV